MAGNHLPTVIDISMRRMAFHEWMETREHRIEEVPDVMRLALLIAQSGAAGISRQDLARVLRLSPDTVEDLLMALVAAGQVTVLRVNGQRVFRASL